MTVPLTPQPAPSFPPPPPAPEPVDFPLAWLLDHASPSIQYRASVDVARLVFGDASPFHLLPYAEPPALALAFAQSPDGIWIGAMLTVPPSRSDSFAGVGTINAVRRLLEYGWLDDTPLLILERRQLYI